MELNIKLSNNNAASLLNNAWNKIDTFTEAISNVPDLQKKALNTAANILKKSIKDEFVQKMPAAGRPFKVPATSKGGYKILKDTPLEEAVRQNSATETHAKVFMGGREPNSPLFIARMYNKGSKERYVRTFKGRKLLKNRFVGHIDGVDYWDPGIASGEQEAISAVNRIFYNYTKTILEGNGS